VFFFFLAESVLDYDGGKVNGTNVTVNFAKEFNKFMHTRQ
jgi:hypothetical protein